MSTVHLISRRDFLRATGLSGSALVLGVNTSWGHSLVDGLAGATEFQPNVFVSIDETGVRFVVARMELGQGGRTACLMMLAEELEVNIEDVEFVQGVADPKYGNQHTAGSTTVRTQWLPLRTAGAAAREMLVTAAADTWGVPETECHCEGGFVIHRSSDRSLAYGELATKASTLPVPGSPNLKSRDEFDIIGKPRRMVDVPDITTGKAVFGYDIDVPGMLYASLERSPRVRGSIKSYDADAARAVAGVVDVVELEPNATGLTNNSIAVVAENSWAAMQGRRALNAEWDPGPLASENSDEYASRLEEIASQEGRVIRQEGDFDAALAAADRVIESTYTGPYIVHAPMEPPCATVHVEGDRCQVWTSVQAPQWARREVAGVLGIPTANVTVNPTLVGGAFGRKSKPDYCVEAAALSKKLGRPVKVAFTREDDIRHGFYRAQNCQKLTGTIDADGQVSGWRGRTVFPTIGWDFNPNRLGPTPNETGQGFTNLPYRIPNLRLEAGSIASSVRVGWLRSVCNTYHSFASNCFMDELAHATGRDPVEFHLEMLGDPRILEFSDEDRQSSYKFDTGRLAAVIRAAADMSNWGRTLPEGHGLGFATQYSFVTYVAMVAHVSVSDRGTLKVHTIDCAVDCGPVVNPLTVEAQMQGAVGIGLSMALHGKITLTDAVVDQGNFDDYPVVRMNEMPKVNSRFIQTDTLPSGIGEPGVPPTAPAVCNAIFAATGKRIYDLPVSGQDLG
jgi:isoquinoline 1-oxidoreductase beta subunit